MTTGRKALLVVATLLIVPVVLAGQDKNNLVISLIVDVTQAPQDIIHTYMEIPVTPGPLTLYFPKWIPGEHAPYGPVLNLTGLKFEANQKMVPWHQDLQDMFTFHIDVPTSTANLEVYFDYLSSPDVSGFAISTTERTAVISWNQNLLYPANYQADKIIFRPTLRLPPDWKCGTALRIAKQAGNEIRFEPVSLIRMVDSPVICGEYFRTIDVTPPGESVSHEIDIAADSKAALEMSPALRQAYTKLVSETDKLFGARHYRDYRFLLTLSDHYGRRMLGLEHHDSEDSRSEERFLIDPLPRKLMAVLLPHEFAHSWNGKFRRPDDLTTPPYEASQNTDLLWVYEGLTEYLGYLLTVRSGLWTPEEYGQHLALVGAELGAGRPGRTWRSLQNTANATPMIYYAPQQWTSWRRGAVDYYNEGLLIWLEVETIIDQQSHGQKSLDDFCRLFFGGSNNGPEVKTYSFDDLVSTLNHIVPYDWAKYFHTRLHSTSPDAPLGGIEASGWKLVYGDRKSQMLSAEEDYHKTIDVSYSIGLLLNQDGDVRDSIYGGVAYHAGVSPGMRIVAVNGRKFEPQVLHDALQLSKASPRPLELLVLDKAYYKTIKLDYHEGERFPELVRDADKPDLLNRILKPLSTR